MALSNLYAAHFTFERFKRNHQRYADMMADKMDDTIIEAWNRGGMDALQKELAAAD